MKKNLRQKEQKNLSIEIETNSHNFSILHFGSKGMRHYKHTGSKTQTHNQKSPKIKRKLLNIPQVGETG